MRERRLQIDVTGSVQAFEKALQYLQFKTKIYRLLFRGKGPDFDGYRNYEFDDDASVIDWKASLRANDLLVRRYIEEKDQRIVFIIDVSDSMVFGSEQKLKCEYAAELASAFAHLIATSGDRIGFILFSDRVLKYVLPRAGLQQFHFFVSELSNPGIYGGAPKMSTALRFATDYFEKLSSVIIVSDFVHHDSDFVRALRYLANKFETIALMIKDPRDLALPSTHGEVLIIDPSSGEQLLINPGVAKEAYEKYAEQQEKLMLSILHENNVDTLRLLTSEPFSYRLANFLKERIMWR